MEDTSYSKDRQPSRTSNPSEANLERQSHQSSMAALIRQCKWQRPMQRRRTMGLPSLDFMMAKTHLRPHEETSESRSPTYSRYVSVVV